MSEVTIRNRSDGIVELSPRVSPLPASARCMIIFGVLLIAIVFFVSGAIPAPVVLPIMASALAGEVVLAVKAAFLALARPPAVVEQPRRFAPPR